MQVEEDGVLVSWCAIPPDSAMLEAAFDVSHLHAHNYDLRESECRIKIPAPTGQRLNVHTSALQTVAVPLEGPKRYICIRVKYAETEEEPLVEF